MNTLLNSFHLTLSCFRFTTAFRPTGFFFDDNREFKSKKKNLNY